MTFNQLLAIADHKRPPQMSLFRLTPPGEITLTAFAVHIIDATYSPAASDYTQIATAEAVLDGCIEDLQVMRNALRRERTAMHLRTLAVEVNRGHEPTAAPNGHPAA